MPPSPCLLIQDGREVGQTGRKQRLFCSSNFRLPISKSLWLPPVALWSLAPQTILPMISKAS